MLELSKNNSDENNSNSMMMILKKIILNEKLIIPRLKVFENIVPFANDSKGLDSFLFLGNY